MKLPKLLTLACFTLCLILGGSAYAGARRNIIRGIEANPSFGAHQIEIEHRSGVITLKGDVASEADRQFLVQTALREAHGAEVRDRLTINPRLAHKTRQVSDAVLVERIQSRLAQMPTRHIYKVRISSLNGQVTLKGSVDSTQGAEQIVDEVRAIPGVRGVENLLSTAPLKSDSELQRALSETLRGSPETDLRGIEYTVDDGIVTFSGHTNNHRTIDRILSQTLMVDGVRDIRSTVKIRR